MASTIKVTNIDTPDGTGSITIDRPTILQAGDIIGADIANDAIDSQHYTDGSIDGEHLSAVMNPSLTTTGKALVLGF